MSGISRQYDVRFIPQGANPHPLDENIDVQVFFDTGATYVATFFAMANIHGLMEKNRRSGECLNGLYLWASDMIIVEVLTLDAVLCTVADLLASGEFESAFSGPHWPDPQDGE